MILKTLLVMTGLLSLTAAHAASAFDDARARLLEQAQQEYGDDLSLYSVGGTEIGASGELSAQSKVTVDGSLVTPLPNGRFDMIDVFYTYSNGAVGKTVEHHETGGGAWLRTPTFSAKAALGAKLDLAGVTRALRHRGQRFDSYHSLQYTFTDSEAMAPQWFAHYLRKRLLFGPVRQIAGINDASGAVQLWAMRWEE